MPPAPSSIRTARKSAGLTQAQAAETVSVAISTWRKWEAGTHRMPPPSFEMFLLKTQSKKAVEK
ncbi:helix-turn-helix domain-containing protein [Acetobacter senegalensis]|uniref:helix-turn-helix domain-containing protein n=1 Tax=Acetobacter senegalensis TaxID=446692 RepID=UPI0034566D32